MIPAVFCSVVSIALGTLYPAYASYKAIKVKKSKDCVQWMKYWVVFALFTSVESFIDFFFSFWFPFYNEIKIVFLLWLLSPLTEGSSLVYRKFLHPTLLRREKEIDKLITATQTNTYNAAIEIAKKGMKYATELVTREVVRAPRLMEDALTEADQIGIEQPGNEGNVDIPVPNSETVDNLVPTIIVDDFLSDNEMGPQDIPSARDEHEQVEAEIEPSTSQVPYLKKQSGHLLYSSGSDSDTNFEPVARQTKTKVVKKTATRRSTRKKQ